MLGRPHGRRVLAGTKADGILQCTWWRWSSGRVLLAVLEPGFRPRKGAKLMLPVVAVCPISQHSDAVMFFYKKGDLLDWGNWRPITLLCVDYKIADKALSNRLKVIGSDASPDQTCGVPGRLVKNVRLLHNVVDYPPVIGVRYACRQHGRLPLPGGKEREDWAIRWYTLTLVTTDWFVLALELFEKC